MKIQIRIIALISCVLFLQVACTNVPVQGVSPVTTAGQDVNALAAEATQVWIDYKAGRVDYAYAMAHGLYAYQTIVKTGADVKALVKAWTGDGTFADKLARIFTTSTSPPEATANAMANGLLATASDKGP